MSNCRCAEIHRIDSSKEGGPSDLEVYRYIYGHLRWLTDSEQWETLYGCPDTGRLWKEYSSHPEYHLGGWPIVEQISPAAAAATFGWAPPPDERLAAIRAAPASAQASVDQFRRKAAEDGLEIDWNDSKWWDALRRRGIKREEIEI